MIFSEVRIEKENLKFNTNIFCPKKNHSDSDKNKNLTLLVNCVVWIWNIHSKKSSNGLKAFDWHKGRMVG